MKVSESMKLIDLLNKITNNELEHKTRFKIFTNNYTLLCEYDKNFNSILFVDSLNNVYCNFILYYIHLLNNKVELIENKEINCMTD